MQGSSIKLEAKPQFAGHETFPLRLLWLKKAYDAIGTGVDARIFLDQSAITTFGVGRNMAVAIRYWALSSGFFFEHDRIIEPTPLGKQIFADDGLDPYLEQIATVWLAHWHITSTPELSTTSYYIFNHLNAIEFDPASIVEELCLLVAANNWRASRVTLKRDVDVFLRSYVRRDDAFTEDAAEPLLAELSIIRNARLGGWYEFVRGPKPRLHDSVFAYALGQFWERSGSPTTLSVEQICFGPGSPGRVFKLDEDSIVTRLMRLGTLTNGAWQWVDTAGLRQIQRFETFDPMATISHAFASSASLRQAA